jgi:DNA primase
MNFPPGFLDEIRTRIAVSDVVGRRVQLKKRGREWVGLSPFNPEKTPSFTVNDQKGFYHCFSSGKHGDVFTFLMETEGLSFPEAVERLAQDAGLEVPKQSADAQERELERKSLIDVMELAARFFEERLQSGEGAAARGYLADRGLAAMTQRAFRLGYAPADRRSLKTHLADQGVSTQEMVAAGLVISGDDIAVPYDRFRERVMFPIGDAKGRVIAFGGRALSADAPAKYLNSPETELFHKGAILYNLASARRAAHETDSLIVVEGYMDVIALAAAGFEHVVAPLGTALTADQLRLMWRMVPEPVLCLDGDAAGLKAAYRSLETALPLIRPGHSLRYALLPDGQDPDDLIRNQGPEAMDAVLASARPMAEMLWVRETEGKDLSTPERRASLETRLEAALREIDDDKVKRHYGAYFKDRLDALWSRDAAKAGGRGGGGRQRGFEPRGGRQRFGAPSGSRHGRSVTQSLKKSALARANVTGGVSETAARSREAVLLLSVVHHPFLLDRYLDDFADVEFTSRELDRLRNEILDIAAHHAPLDNRLLETQLEGRGQLESVRQVGAGLASKGEWFMEREAAPRDAETGWRHTLSLHRKSLTLQKELKAAERVLAQEPSEENLAHLNDIREQISSAVGEEATIEGFGEASGRMSSTVG